MVSCSLFTKKFGRPTVGDNPKTLGAHSCNRGVFRPQNQ